MKLGNWRLWIEFKLSNCWIGVYWRSRFCAGGPSSFMERSCTTDEWFRSEFDLFICLLPMLPIHIHWDSPNRYDW